MLLFGPQAQHAKAREITVIVQQPTAREVLSALAQNADSLASSLPASRLAVNHQFVDDDHRLEPSDEVALIGMVSGG